MLAKQTVSIQPSRTYWEHSSERVNTADGWQLQIRRLRAGRTWGPPVVLIPGHATTAWTFFAGEHGGIASALAASGRDVWAFDPRGSIGSEHYSGSNHVRVSDKVVLDLPAVFSHVLGRTGADQVDAVGHSLGGVMIYLHGLTAQRVQIRRAVTLASPMWLNRRAVPAPLRSKLALSMARRLGRVPLRGLVNRTSGKLAMNFFPVHFDPTHTNQRVFKAFLSNGVCDVFGPELNELLHWIRARDVRALMAQHGGAKPVRAALEIPTRFVVGSMDKLTPPEAVFEAFTTLGGCERDFHVLGVKNGYGRDYRHGDILLGDHVREDVAPLVVDWLS